MAGHANQVIGPDAGEVHWLGRLGARIIHRSADGALVIVEHPLGPRALGSPVHTHANEDEYSFILEGTVGFELGGEAFEASTGALVVKPRHVPHAFWNPTDEPARILELISPAGFENYFIELAAVFPKGPPTPESLAAFAAIRAKYSLDADGESAARLRAEHNLTP